MTPQPLFTATAAHVVALALATVTTLGTLSAVVGLADGYRHAQVLAQAASQPVASIAAAASKPKA